MSRVSKIPPLLSDPDFLTFEVDRLIHSVRVRLEQQQIHIEELAGHESERLNAKRRLKLMQAALKKLLEYKERWGRSNRPGQ